MKMSDIQKRFESMGERISLLEEAKKTSLDKKIKQKPIEESNNKSQKEENKVDTIKKSKSLRQDGDKIKETSPPSDTKQEIIKKEDKCQKDEVKGDKINVTLTESDGNSKYTETSPHSDIKTDKLITKIVHTKAITKIGDKDE